MKKDENEFIEIPIEGYNGNQMAINFEDERGLYADAINDFIEQQKFQIQKGMEKYGISLEDVDLTVDEIKTHAIQELVDANHYIHYLYRLAQQYQQLAYRNQMYFELAKKYISVEHRKAFEKAISNLQLED